MDPVKLIDPIIRLKLLNEYMIKWVDCYPMKLSFHEWIRKSRPEYIPDTPEFAKAAATHCFYCNVFLIKNDSTGSELFRSTIDHYYPKSKGETTKYVICCARCNFSKGDTLPVKLVSTLTRAALKGRTVWGISGKKLQYIAAQIQKITNDIIYKTGPKVYYIKK